MDIKLIMAVFMEFEAPDYPAKGIETFTIAAYIATAFWIVWKC